MRVIVAHTAGFCMGVRRAMNKAFITLGHEKGPIYTHGPIIHNPQVVKLLEERGVTKLEEIGRDLDGTIIIRAHGISPRERDEIRSTRLEVVDATCPKVARVHAAAKKHHQLGYLVVVVGDEDHAEVRGILGYTWGEGRVLSRAEEAKRLPGAEKVLVVAQTTFGREMFYEILDAIHERYPKSEIKAIDTICDSTRRRQDEVKELARRVDAMVIVGGKTSGNTKRLFDVSTQSGVPSFHVEDETELDPKKLKKFKTIGLTAGASTPNWVIMKVADFLSGIGKEVPEGRLRIRWARQKLIKALRFMVLTNIYAAISAGGLAIAAACLLGVNDFWKMPLISGLFIFSMYILNRTQDPEAMKFNDPQRERFYRNKRGALTAGSVVSSLVSMLLALTISPTAFLLLIAATLLGVAYSVKVLPPFLTKYLKYRRLKDIPASKTFFVAGAWAGVSAAMPYLSAVDKTRFSSFVVVFAFCFFVVLTRAALYDIRDIQGDAVVGRETIPILIGKKWTQILVLMFIGLVTALMIASAVGGLITPLAYPLLIIPAYSLLSLYLYHRRVIFQGTLFELVTDFEFIMAGLVSVLWFWIKGGAGI